MKLALRTYRNAFVLPLLAIFAFQISALAQDKASKIDNLVSLYHKYGQFNGSVLVADNGKVVYQKGLGLANMEWNMRRSNRMPCRSVVS